MVRELSNTVYDLFKERIILIYNFFFLSILQGLTGPPGNNGNDGAPGERGATGPGGQSGTPGERVRWVFIKNRAMP